MRSYITWSTSVVRRPGDNNSLHLAKALHTIEDVKYSVEHSCWMLTKMCTDWCVSPDTSCKTTEQTIEINILQLCRSLYILTFFPLFIICPSVVNFLYPPIFVFFFSTVTHTPSYPLCFLHCKPSPWFYKIQMQAVTEDKVQHTGSVRNQLV